MFQVNKTTSWFCWKEGSNARRRDKQIKIKKWDFIQEKTKKQQPQSPIVESKAKKEHEEDKGDKQTVW